MWKNDNGAIAEYDAASHDLAFESKINESESGLALVGVIGGNCRIVENIVSNGLAAAGIKSVIEGGAVYYIGVRSDQVKAAISVLARDPKLNGVWILLKNPQTGKLEQRKNTNTGGGPSVK
jgi:hypothetical protein